MAEDKRVKKYFENMPYGQDSKAWEIHGPANQAVINDFVTNLVKEYDNALKEGDKQKASIFQQAIYRIHQDGENLKTVKEEFAMNYGGGVGGKNLFSNYTDLSWDREFMTENGRIGFDKRMRPVLIVDGPNGEVVKNVEDVTQDWVIKGDEENQFMTMQQDAIKQRNNLGQPLDFDIDWAVSNLLQSNDSWKSFVSDKIGGRYFLQDWLIENQDAVAAGQVSDEMLHPDSFNPEFDSRLHQHYADRLRKSFDPNYQTPAETRSADKLRSKTNPETNN